VKNLTWHSIHQPSAVREIDSEEATEPINNTPMFEENDDGRNKQPCCVMSVVQFSNLPVKSGEA
jgi:hypothetical protein